MSAATYTLPSTTRPSSLRIFLNEIRYAVLLALRTKAFSLSASSSSTRARSSAKAHPP